MDDNVIWKIIDSYFRDNPNYLVRHHLESYNDFFKTGIFKIFKEKNPITIVSKYDETIDEEYRHTCVLYFGGKSGNKIYFGKPVIYDDDENIRYMFPNEARLRNMTYGMTVHYDIEIEYIDILEKDQAPYSIDITMLEKNSEFPELDQSEINYENEHYKEEIRIPKNPKKELTKVNENKNKDDNKKINENENEDEKESDIIKGGGISDIFKNKQKVSETGLKLSESNKLQNKLDTSLVNSHKQVRRRIIEKVLLGKFPIMLQSDFCVLNNIPKSVKYSMGECRNDPGGYFIIDGKEKTIIPQEKFGDNMLYIRHVNNTLYLYSAEIRSVSEIVSKPIRTLSVKIVAPSPQYTNKNIVVNIPNVRKSVPLFIVFRALGIISDKSIIEFCLLDTEKYSYMYNLFIPSIYDSAAILTQETALQYIASLTKYHTTAYALEILCDYFLPHIGETNFFSKAYYLGYIVFQLLLVNTGKENETDRDNYKYKRIELVGSLISDLFREYYTIQLKDIHLQFEKRLYFNQSVYGDDLVKLINDNYDEILKERQIEKGFKKAFKGDWGSATHTKRIGVIQDLNRLSFNSAVCHLRKTGLPLDDSAKVIGPRLLHSSQWGFIDPVDTPDGGNIGLHKSLAIATTVSRGYSREPMIQWLKEKVSMRNLEECSPIYISKQTKIIINGYWCGVVGEPFAVIQKIQLFRRNGLLPIYTNASFDIKKNTIFIYTDAGRVCRPIFYIDDGNGDIDAKKQISYNYTEIMKRLIKGEFTWEQLTRGFVPKRLIKANGGSSDIIYELNELYSGVSATETEPLKMKRFIEDKAIIDYIDPSESENALIAQSEDDILVSLNKNNSRNKNIRHTHLELHHSMILGIMGNQIIFPENNPLSRNLFSCGQSKQGVSLYHTNYQMRMDKTAVVLNYGQTPVLKSRYLENINGEENYCGVNTIVAIMCYTGYNVEDAILINQGAIDRGLFNTTYFSVYESHEEMTQTSSGNVNKHIMNINNIPTVIGTKPGYDYSYLDKYGLISENMPVNDKTVLIGMTTSNLERPSTRVDASVVPKKGQLGIVDKTFITEGDEGTRIAKIRIRETRIPSIGDKMASRSGQKGVIGLVISECDMPFTKDGMRPDIIINPHAVPSRMTLGQLVECIVGKACILAGAHGDCTAFNNRGSKISLFGEQLTKHGYNSTGNEILYNGMTGEQLETAIFIGPTYYMRLKHMVKDKINYRARGPNTAMTRQPVSGRANDGGLRIGEMERDVLLSYGMTNMLCESMMERADKYSLAICNQSGMIAIYNPTKNIFISPMIDGPIQYIGEENTKNKSYEEASKIKHITQYGRDFSVLQVPYSFKLLIQELQTMNIQMRIITDKNIEQLENMIFSKNAENLTGNHDTSSDNIAQILTGAYKEVIGGKRYEKWRKENKHISNKNKIINKDSDSDSDSDNIFTIKEIVDSDSSIKNIEQNNNSHQHDEEQYNSDDDISVNLPSSYIKNQYNNDTEIFSPKNNNDYDIGDIVYYRGDTKSTRNWKIKKKGKTFYTIETEDSENISDKQERIKIVLPMDIYKPPVELSTTRVLDTLLPALNTTNTHNETSLLGSAIASIATNPNILHNLPANNGIQINPIIKIINGPDNSVIPEHEIQSYSVDNKHLPIATATVAVHNNEILEQQLKLKENDEVSKEIDFSKGPVIVKKI